MRKFPVICMNFLKLTSGLAAGRCAAPLIAMAAALLIVSPSLAAKKIPLPRPKPPALLELQPDEPEEAVAIWVREDIAPLTRELGEPMRALDNFASYRCRGRNNIIGAKMSEHGRGNALDIRGVMLAKAKVEWTDVHVAHKFRDKIKASACARFMTVL